MKLKFIEMWANEVRIHQKYENIRLEMGKKWAWG